MSSGKQPKAKRAPQIQRAKFAGEVETIDEFLARGGEIHLLKSETKPYSSIALPVGFSFQKPRSGF